MKKTATRDKIKNIYLSGLCVADVLKLANISKATFYKYKKLDLEDGIDWDEIAYAKARTGTNETSVEIMEAIAGDVSAYRKKIKTLPIEKQIQAEKDLMTILSKAKTKKTETIGANKKSAQPIVNAEETQALKIKMLGGEYGLYPYQKAFLSDQSRFRLWLKSRQIGATYGCSGECLADAMGGLDQLIISASEEQALKWNSEIQKHAAKLGIVLGGSETKITTPIGTTIYIFANNFRTIQGFSGSVWLDEFAWYTNPKRIWEAFIPSITSVKTGETKARVTILSTPFEQNSLFHKLVTDVEKYYMFSRHTTTIHDAVTDGLDVDVDVLRDLFDSDSWSMMYECVFVDDESALLPVALIQSAVDHKLRLESSSAEALRAGYDIGRKIDLSVLAAFALREDKYVLATLDTYRKATFDAQRTALSTFLNLYPEAVARIDATGIGSDLAETMQKRYKKRAVQVLFTQSSKEAMALNLKKAFEDGKVTIPNDPLLIADLHAIKRKAGARGFLYDADRNEHGHADRFWACALALFGEDFIQGKTGFNYGQAAAFMEKQKTLRNALKMNERKKDDE